MGSLRRIPRRADRTYHGRVIRVGTAAFVIGVVCTLVALSPLVTGAQLSGAWWFLAMLTGAGFLLILVGLLRNARARSAAVRAAGENA